MASMLGSTDRRLIAPKALDYRLSQQLAGWRRVDPPPQRVTPASLRLIDYAHELAVLHPTTLQHAVVDMSYVTSLFSTSIALVNMLKLPPPILSVNPSAFATSNSPLVSASSMLPLLPSRRHLPGHLRQFNLHEPEERR
jgi:hypothetical protein